MGVAIANIEIPRFWYVTNYTNLEYILMVSTEPLWYDYENIRL